MKRFLLSLAVAVAGTGLAFFFLMSAAVPILALYARLTTGAADAQTVTVDPAGPLRYVGLPLSVVVFCLCFWLVWRRLRPQPHGTHASST